MISNAEKLARELIALNETYSAKDFERAVEMIQSGKLFEKTIAATQAIGGKRSRTLAPSLRRKARPPRTLLDETATPSSTFEGADGFSFDFESFDGDRSEIITFAKRFQNREILKTGASARMFAQQLGLQLPKSIPARSALLKSLLRALGEAPVETRARLLAEADSISTGESSLQRWSDLIVKR